MRSYVPLAGAVVLLALAGPVLAQPKDPAELFPAQTLAYFEMRQPDKLSRELVSLIQGSALEDLASVFAKARTERGDTPDAPFFFGGMIYGEMGMLFSPEALAEIGRFGGGAVAITGWNKDDGPEVVGVIYTGESNLLTMYMRAFLVADNEMRIADKVEGVNLFRAHGRDYRFAVPNAPGGAPPPEPPIKDKGPTLALMPGMVVIASTPKGAREVVRRAKGKVSEPALASLGSFKRGASLREKPGVFAFADVGALTAQVDATPTERKGRSDWDTFKTVFNPRGMGTAVASLSLQNGNLDFQMQLQVDPKQPSPLLDLLPDRKTALDGLHFAPKDGLLTVTLPWTDGAKRWEKVVALIDSVARTNGAPADFLPSKMIADAEQKAGLNLGTDLFAKVAGFTLTVDVSGDLAKSHMPLQLAVTAKDEDAAKALDALVPKLLALGGGATGDPTTEKVDGVTLRTYSKENVPWREALSYGREGKTLVLGPTKGGVAAALAGGAKNGGLLGDTKVAAVLKDTGDAQMVGAWSLGETILGMMQLSSSGETRVSVKPAGGGATVEEPPIPRKPGEKEAEKAADAKFAKEMRQAVAPLAPALVTLTRKGDLVILEAKQAGLKTVSVRTINVLIDAAAHEMLSPRVRTNTSAGSAIPDELPGKP